MDLSDDMPLSHRTFLLIILIFFHPSIILTYMQPHVNSLYVYFYLLSPPYSQRARLLAMGFQEDWVVAALTATDDDEGAALNILLQKH
jgi:hypothetical protein